MGETSSGIFYCPPPFQDYTGIQLGHGSGGKMSADLLRRVFLPLFTNPYLRPLNDAALVEVNGVRLAMSTDSFVVNPIFFPGGDIGRLAVNGTVNDLAMVGAWPLFLSVAFILEEGFPLEQLRTVATSVAAASQEVGVTLVTGDTKVVERGSGDGVFINTTGLGLVDRGANLSAQGLQAGGKIILSGPIGLHGMAIMSTREGLGFETEIESDTVPLHSLVAEMLAASSNLYALRDPTRGGLSSALNELAASSGVGIIIDEQHIPIPSAVRAACEMLGLDPLYVANEGKLVAAVAPEDAEQVLSRMRAHPYGRDAVMIGEVVEEPAGLVVMRTAVGGTRVVDMLAGEQLPRIC